MLAEGLCRSFTLGFETNCHVTLSALFVSFWIGKSCYGHVDLGAELLGQVTHVHHKTCIMRKKKDLIRHSGPRSIPQ